jgi:hypothetical protein
MTFDLSMSLHVNTTVTTVVPKHLLLQEEKRVPGDNIRAAKTPKIDNDKLPIID